MDHPASPAPETAASGSPSRRGRKLLKIFVVTALFALAAVGGALGLGAGALIGDQLQGQEIQQQQQDEQLRRNQLELERQRQEIERMRRREY